MCYICLLIYLYYLLYFCNYLLGIITGTNFEGAEIGNCYASGQVNVSIGTSANIGRLVH